MRAYRSVVQEYRGTKVAVKRAIRTKRRNGGSTKSGSKGLSSFQDYGRRISVPSAPTVDTQPESPAAGSTPDTLNSSGACGESVGTPPSTDEFVDDVEALSGQFELSRSSKNFSVGFLTKELGGGKSKYFFGTRKSQVQDFHQSILGSVSASHRSSETISRLLCPCLSEAVRREEEFKTEMRVLSR